jgi:putative peptidoglycan lipid II flippase
MSIIKSTAIVSFYTLISRILGYVRDIFIASTLGASWINDAFIIAYRLPNAFRRIFAEGAFASAFVPIYAAKLHVNESDANNFANQAMSFLLIILLILCSLMQIFMPYVVKIYAYGFSGDVDQFEYIVMLCRITTPYLVFICVVALLSGLLNSHNKFASPAASPVILNLFMTSAIIFFGSDAENTAFILSWAITCAGIVQLAALLYACRKVKIPVKIVLPKWDKDIKRLWKNMIPVAIGSGITQITMIVDTAMATQGDGWVSYLYFADRISQLPLGLIGIALGTVLLPALSKHRRAKNLVELGIMQNKAIEVGLMLTMPCAFALMCIAFPIITILFERGAFNETASWGSATALIAFGTGIPAFVLIKILTPNFYSAYDTKTPMKIALFCLTGNILLNFTLIPYFGHIGIAAATSIMSWVNVSMLCYYSCIKDLLKIDKKIISSIGKIILSCVIMSLVLLISNNVIEQINSQIFAIKIILFILMISLGVISYFAVIFATKLITITDFKIFILRKKL